MRKEKIPTIKNGIKDVSTWLDAKDHEQLYRDILADKAPKRTEIEVSFFQKCNLRCAFCWQDHDDLTGTNSIIDKSAIVLEYLRQSKDLKKDITITMTGGELFQDGVNYAEDYLNFMMAIAYSEFNIEHNISFTLITNLIFKEIETAGLLSWLLRKAKVLGISLGIGTSYDPTGRVINNNFYDNVHTFSDSITGTTVVLTKPTIDWFLNPTNNKIKYADFRRFFHRLKPDFDYYVPTEMSDSLMPSDKDLLEFFRFAIKEFKWIPLVESWLKSETNMITCGNLNKITILPDGSITPCRQLDYKGSEFKTPINKCSNTDMMQKFMDKHGCLSCPYFSKCTMTCFVMNDHVTYKEELDDCLYRILFKEIDGLNRETHVRV